MDVMLTFDVEDFINVRSIWSLSRVLMILDRFNVNGIFFFTGHMAEKIAEYPEIVKQLKKHKIGYHSSSHSVRPGILEFCDVEEYERAVEISLKKETSHINPITGLEEGPGGLKKLEATFGQEIDSFRAPSCAWAPPHLDALKRLGIDFDFSTFISRTPFLHRGIIFYPAPIWAGFQIRSFSSALHYVTGVYLKALSKWRDKILVFGVHPSHFVNSEWWDSIYRSENLKKLRGVNGVSKDIVEKSYRAFEVMIENLRTLERIGLVRITCFPRKTTQTHLMKADEIRRVYEENLQRYINVYRSDLKPRYLFSHFKRFLGD